MLKDYLYTENKKKKFTHRMQSNYVLLIFMLSFEILTIVVIFLTRQRFIVLHVEEICGENCLLGFSGQKLRLFLGF